MKLCELLPLEDETKLLKAVPTGALIAVIGAIVSPGYTPGALTVVVESSSA